MKTEKLKVSDVQFNAVMRVAHKRGTRAGVGATTRYLRYMLNKYTFTENQQRVINEQIKF